MTDTSSYTPATFAQALLEDIGAPVDSTTEQTVEDWEAAEGGAGPQWGIAGNTDDYNPINTTLPEPGSVPTNSAGVQAYTSWGQGLEATVSTLEEPAYANVVADLKASAAETQTAADIGASPWGTPNFDPGGTPQAGPGSSSSTGATLTSFNANPFDLFGIPQTIVGGAASSIWSEVGPFLVKAMLVVFGLGLIVIAGYRATAPARHDAEQAAAPVAEALA